MFIVKKIFQQAKLSDSNFPLFLFKRIYYKLLGKNIIAHHLTEIKNPQNIETHGTLKIGVDYIGFSSKHDRTFLNVRGKLIFRGNYSIGKGCRFDVGPEALIEIGTGGYVSANTNFLISHGLKIGNDCMISWGCQFLDEDFHKLEYENKNEIKTKSIVIGNHIWIGCNSFIYKGVNISDGCIVAANSVVKSSFTEKNVLIAGNPAEIVKHNIIWKD